MNPSSSERDQPPLRCADHQCSLADAFAVHRSRLTRLIDLRLDGRLRNRIDASDVLQDAFVRLVEQEMASQGPAVDMPYLWIRKIVLWTLIELQRKHLGVQGRDVRREQSMDALVPSVSSLELAECLLDSHTSPSEAAQRAEQLRRVQFVLEQLEPLDREILVLRHCEQLSRSESAEVLGITTSAAAKRYIRALGKCRHCLTEQGWHNV